MASFNKVILLGNLTRDPEVKYLQSGAAIANVSLAVNRTWFDQKSNEKKEEVTFVEVTAFGRTAEVIGEYCIKGKPLMVEGRLKLEQWEDKQSGQKRSKLIVIAEDIQLLGDRGGQRARSGDATNQDDGSRGGESQVSDEVPF